MKIARKAVTAVLGIFLAALVIAALAPKATRGFVAALVEVANTNSNPVPTAMATHVSARPSSFVALTCNSSSPSTPSLFTCTQVLKDGTSASFSVPSGRALIVTDASWTLEIQGNPPCSTIPAELFLGSVVTEGSATGVARVADFLVSDWDAMCFGVGSRQYSGGLVFHAGDTLGVVPNPQTAAVIYVSLHGYLTTDD